MAKKDFKTASELFLTPQEPAQKPEGSALEGPEAAAIPDGYKIIREAKTERLQILIRPTTHEKLKHIAAETGQSKNEIINNLIENYIKGAE